ncbi:MAG TPA: hypothetical protein VF702_12230 [Allosphingosinicella sp.]|jgi:hypothetical protein
MSRGRPGTDGIAGELRATAGRRHSPPRRHCRRDARAERRALKTWRAAAPALLAALAACNVAAQDCSLGARLATHARERAQFRQALILLVRRSQCPSTHPEVLIPEENRVSQVRERLRERIRASELRGDLDTAESEWLRAQEFVNEADCVGVRWKGDEYVRQGRESLAHDLAQLRAIEARFIALSRRLAECGGG